MQGAEVVVDVPTLDDTVTIQAQEEDSGGADPPRIDEGGCEMVHAAEWPRRSVKCTPAQAICALISELTTRGASFTTGSRTKGIDLTS